jgi:MFS family permease
MILAKFTKPSHYIGILVTCWGTIVTLSGLVQNLAGLCVVRFLIGLFEAGFFPGAVWLISQWCTMGSLERFHEFLLTVR